MPFRRRYNARRPRRRPRRVPGLATRPRMMGTMVARKRFQQVHTRVFWFKRNGFINPDLAGNNYSFWNGREINVPATTPVGWDALKTLYEQYKVLAIKVKLFPANVGVEPDSALFASNALLRGDVAVWNDQRFDTATPAPTNINEVINIASCRMINARRPYSRRIFRARGYPQWANTQGPSTVDSWNGSIELLINNATPAPATGPAPTLWYYTVQYKIAVRGRTQS